MLRESRLNCAAMFCVELGCIAVVGNCRAAGLPPATLPFAPSVGWVALSIAFWPLGTAFTFPAVTAMLSKVISNEDRGLYMGVQQTFGGMSRVIFPIALGWAFDHMVPGAPFWISATLVIMTLSFSMSLPPGVTARKPSTT